MRRRGYALMVVLATLGPGRAMALPTPVPSDPRAVTATHAATPGLDVAPAGEAVPQAMTLPQQMEALRTEMGELRAGLQDPARQQVPAWAVQMQEQLDRRIERMAEMQERLAARIETPTPRLDEPIVLFTVAGCTLLLGFVVGRGVQRRSNRRDLRLRL